jgi:putative DNA primase/helicase
MDVWEPLLAIADLAGGNWPVGARRAAIALAGSAEDTDPAVELLTDIATEVLVDETRTVIPTQEIISTLVAIEHKPWATWKHDKPISPRGLARLLGPLGVHPVHLRNVRGYRTDAFADAFARYLPSEASQRHDINNDGPKPCDGSALDGPQKNASVTQFEADFVGSVTQRHIDLGDDSDEHF